MAQMRLAPNVQTVTRCCAAYADAARLGRVLARARELAGASVEAGRLHSALQEASGASGVPALSMERPADSGHQEWGTDFPPRARAISYLSCSPYLFEVLRAIE